ncbi:hypothetical protein HY086_01750 [Candidatus Gottesmanbacteria bacterium]|nr:hypothetical protein [Candidatus Gottesmanbacteria bacterium]
MNPIIRFVLVAGSTVSVVVIVALLWPKLTSRARPQVLQAVRDTALTTQPGKEAAKILGVDNESNLKPINVNSAIASVAGTVTAAVGEKTKEIIAQQVSTQIVNQYTQLSAPQQQQVQQFICKPQGQ